MELIQIQRVEALLAGEKYMLISRHRMDPRCRTVDVKRAFVEDFRKTRPHMHQRSTGKTIGHQGATISALLFRRLLLADMFSAWRRLGVRWRQHGFPLHPLDMVRL